MWKQLTLIAEINCAGALDGKELFTIEGSENWRSTPDDLEEREKWPSPPYPRKMRTCLAERLKVEARRCRTTGTSITFDELNRNIDHL